VSLGKLPVRALAVAPSLSYRESPTKLPRGHAVLIFVGFGLSPSGFRIRVRKWHLSLYLQSCLHVAALACIHQHHRGARPLNNGRDEIDCHLLALSNINCAYAYGITTVLRSVGINARMSYINPTPNEAALLHSTGTHCFLPSSLECLS